MSAIYYMQFNELLIRGKGEFNQQDIVTALTASSGNTDLAFAELSKPPLPPASPPPPLDQGKFSHIFFLHFLELNYLTSIFS